MNNIEVPIVAVACPNCGAMEGKRCTGARPGYMFTCFARTELAMRRPFKGKLPPENMKRKRNDCETHHCYHGRHAPICKGVKFLGHGVKTACSCKCHKEATK